MARKFAAHPSLPALLLVVSAPLLAQQTAKPAAPDQPLPLKYVGPPTVGDITAGDLMTRLYKFADDSMMGRQVGTKYNDMGTAWIASEVQRMGLRPAGDSGTFFQKVPIVTRQLDSASTVTVGDTVFRAGKDFVAIVGGFYANVKDAPVVYVGATLDTTRMLSPEEARGRILVSVPGGLPPGTNVGEFVQSHGYKAYVEMREAAAANVTVLGDSLPPNVIRQALAGGQPIYLSDSVAITLAVTQPMAEAMLGTPPDQWAFGTTGKPTSTDIRFHEESLPGRNVVAILPGSDPRLKGEYVAIGAHNDHVGFRQRGVDHDSVKAFMEVVRPQGADSPNRPATQEELARIQSIRDSLAASHPARLDSIYNGADDDGSGSVTVLEIAQKFATAKEKPRRSILFVWHTGEEMGLWGANWFTAHPTVPRDSIVAQLNMDMVGRGAASDVTGTAKDGTLLHGGPGYVQLIGSRRLSTEMGDLIEAVNKEDPRLGLTLDYSMDANGHPQNIYCRSDHYEYAKYGIPITFFTTGGHADYHQITDEPQYIQYQHMARVGELVYDSALRIANLDHRLVVDKPKPDPKGTCVQ